MIIDILRIYIINNVDRPSSLSISIFRLDDSVFCHKCHVKKRKTEWVRIERMSFDAIANFIRFD